MKFVHLIWGNLKRKKLRTLLTVLSVLVAFVLFGFLSSIKQALTGGVQMAGADRLIVRHNGFHHPASAGQLQSPHGANPGRGSGHASNLVRRHLSGPEEFFHAMPGACRRNFLAIHPEFILAPEQMKCWLQTRTGAVVGRKTANRFHWKIGDKVPIQSSIWSQTDGSRTWEFDIVGIFDGKEKGTDTTPLFFRYDYFDEARGSGWGKGMVGWYTIRIKDPARAAETAKLVDKEFENSDAETKTEPEGAFVQAWVSQIGNIELIVAAILGAVFFTILLVTGNTMSQAVRERTGELGVLKAIGFTNAQVVSLILVESCLLAVVGGGVGLGLAWLFISRGDPTGGLLPLFFFPGRDLVIGAGLALALGLASGIFPALQGLRLRVADALRRM